MKPLISSLLLAACLLFPAAHTHAQTTTLTTGQIAFTGYQSDTPDIFSFVLLIPVLSGTQITFTDNGWFSTGGFRSNEGTIVWQASTNLASGTQVTFTNNVPDVGTKVSGSLALSTSGDQIFAYQGTAPVTGNESSFLAAIQMNGAWDSDATSSNTSAQPPVFTDGVSSISISPEMQNAVYDCSIATGAAADVRNAINTSSRWSTSNSANLTIPPACNFNITECFLLLGLQPASFDLGNGDKLLVNHIFLNTEVVIRSVPVFFIPNYRPLIGLNLYFQVSMWNPWDFPKDPLQMSNGLRATINGECVPYGKSGGLHLWAPMKAEIGKPFQPAFRIGN